MMFYSSYYGDIDESLSFVDKEQFEYICNYFNITNAYETLQNTCSKINEISTSSQTKDENNVEYRVYVSEHYQPDIKSKITNYYISKTY